MKRGLLPALLMAALAGCSSAPKKSAPAPVSVVTATPAPPLTGRNRACSKVYAPAQEDPGTRGNYKAGGLYAPGVPDTTPDYVPDVDCIAEPLVVALPRSKVGNRSPYAVLGRNYQVLDRVDGYVEQGNASYYGNKFHGRLTSNREVYDMYAFTAAHKSLPLPSFARVTNLDNGRSVVVRVNDRGPFHEGRVIDLSYAAAVKLDIVRRGTGRVEVQALLPGDAGPLLAAASTSEPTTIATGIPTRVATGEPTPMDELVQRLPPPAPVLLAAVQSDAPPAALPQAVASAGNATQTWRYQVAPEPEKAASADEFEAWMLARGVRVATGEPAAVAAVAGMVAGADSAAHAAPPFATSTVVAIPMPAAAGAVHLQVASFASRDNAERALTRITAAGIAGGGLSEVVRDGKTLWRLRVSAGNAASAEGIAVRIGDLGLGQPQVVSD